MHRQRREDLWLEKHLDYYGFLMDINLLNQLRNWEFLKAMFSEIKNNKKQPTMDILDKYASVFEMKKSTLLFAEALENDVEVQNDKKQKVALAGMKLLKILERVGKFEDE